MSRDVRWMVRQTVDVKWVVVGFPIRFVCSVGQVKCYVDDVYPLQVSRGGDFQPEFLEGLDQLLPGIVAQSA